MKEYPVRHDIIIKEGVIEVSDYRAVQLMAGGFIKGKVDGKKAKAEHIENAERKSKVEQEQED